MPEIKTNVMRILEKKKVTFSAHTYPHGDEAVDGATVAELTGQDPDQVFKTLITQGASKQYYVFVIPVLCELDLKKAAKAGYIEFDDLAISFNNSIHGVFLC